jgi:dCMP deaminase
MREDKATKYYELACNFAATFSKDPATKVGAIFLAPDSFEILSMAYNGMPRGINETIPERWERPIKYMWISHAEENGILNAARSGTSLLNSIAIVSHFPCANCARMLIQAGIKTIVTKAPDMNCERWGENYKVSCEMFNEVAMEIQYIYP